MKRNMTATQHNFAMVPSGEFPRSRFHMPQNRKMAFNASDLIPIMCEEVLPGDTWQHHESIAARLATPIAPVLDDMSIETWYFFVPNRIAGKWSLNDDYTQQDWEDFITGVNTSNPVPTVAPPNMGAPPWPIEFGSVADFFGICPAQYTAQLELTAFPFWAYFNIYNEFFRDQNLQAPWRYTVGDWDQFTNGTDNWDGNPLRVNKRSDYFTRSLPWPQKGAAVTMPLGTTAPVIPASAGAFPTFTDGMVTGIRLSGDPALASEVHWSDGTNPVNAGFPAALPWGTTGLVANLAGATSATINAIRLAVTTQKLLELDARTGSRYVENLLGHWGVRAPDGRMFRPEYLGGTETVVTVNPIAQTAQYIDPMTNDSALGNLGAEMHANSSKNTFSFSAVEHGYIIGLAAARSTPTYQQGIRRHWLHRDTRLDYYDPVFANLGEQAVHTDEILIPLNTVPSTPIWGYQEYAAEYRYTPNEICGHLRSESPTPMDWWHYAEEFTSLPLLNEDFITDKTQETLTRSLATLPTAQWSAQIIMDIRHDSTVARIMPAYSVPGIKTF